MEYAAYILALWMLRAVAVLLFAAMGFGWACALLFWLGRFEYKPWR